VLAAGCTTNPPAEGRTWSLAADSITSVQSAGDPASGFTFWDNDAAEEPYLVHLGIRVTLGEPVAVTTSVRSTYSDGGRYICKISQGQTCPGLPGDGPRFNGLNAPDLLDLAMGAKFELVGTVDLLFERDALIPVGIVGLLQGVSDIINAALPAVLGSGGVPSDAQGIIDLLGAVLPGVITTVVGAVGAVIGNLAGADELIGVSPIFYIAVGGTLAGIIRNVLPSLLDLVELALSQQPNNPFPNGLPLSINVLGDRTRVRFGNGTQAPFKLFDVTYRWSVA
jgi:hypothetical protein